MGFTNIENTYTLLHILILGVLFYVLNIIHGIYNGSNRLNQFYGYRIYNWDFS